MKRRDIALAGAAAVAFVVLLASVWAASCGSPSSADELLAGARPSYSDLTDRVVALERQVFILTARVSALESTTTTTVAPTTTTTLPPTTTTVKPTTTTTVPPTTTTTTTVPAAMLNVKDYGAKGDGATDDKDGTAGSAATIKHAFMMALKPALASGNPWNYYA